MNPWSMLVAAFLLAQVAPSSAQAFKGIEMLGPNQDNKRAQVPMEPEPPEDPKPDPPQVPRSCDKGKPCAIAPQKKEPDKRGEPKRKPVIRPSDSMS